MKLSIAKDLTPIRDVAYRTIDAFAGVSRSSYITVAPGQEMVYTQKEKEAEMITADPSISPSLVPHLAAEAIMNGVNLLDQAAIVLSLAHGWRQVSVLIETTRLDIKARVGVATTPAAIDALVGEARTTLSALSAA
ncbi:MULTISPECIES: hypothetical protein [unclassified Ensifer]|uniref:hypothetical protein n=1 Tax=unclassified Ensifer TaxID=2633371 RepID=UPI00081373D7|nr:MULTISPECIES: hypothetical protein [unclassified Ensifer]OCP21888.1 hypothetical protein BC361_25300 [Ensifer sp. LC54]OCP23332.1 hypothetical protein BC363_25465 [Ensifer sp. LC384]